MIRDLYHQGLNISQISREIGFNRRTVRKYITAQVPPTAQTRVRRPSKLDDYREYINQRINEYPLSAARIYHEIKGRGFTGKYTIVKDYIRGIRPREGMPAVLRYETQPGVQAQVDWAECDHIDEDERTRAVHCFSIILGYSRMRYMEYTLSTDVYTFIQCHQHAFEYFGGYTQEILYDNIKQVIIKRAMKAKDHTWNPKFEDFFSHYEFIPRVCKPYCPQTKGKIENSIGFMKRDFLLGGTFTSFCDMNQQLLQWLNRVNATPHGTTNEIPFERLKLENLKSLTGIQPYLIRRGEHRKISKDAYVSYLGNRYSVPYQYAGRSAVLEVSDTQITIRVGSEAVCTHDILSGHHRMAREKEHFKGLLSQAMKCNFRCMKRSQPLFKVIGPDVERRPLSIYEGLSGEVR